MLLSCLWILTACNSEDLSYDIEYTPIHPLGGQLSHIEKARAWDYKQCQREDSKFVFWTDQNRLQSFC